LRIKEQETRLTLHERDDDDDDDGGDDDDEITFFLPKCIIFNSGTVAVDGRSEI
jgi:hypothetical protein